MNKISSIVAILAVIGFGTLPANALEKEINNNTIVPDATEQVKQSTPQGEYCPIFPYCVIYDCCPS